MMPYMGVQHRKNGYYRFKAYLNLYFNRCPGGCPLESKVKRTGKKTRNVVRDKVFWMWKYVLLEAKRNELLDIFPDIHVEYRFGDSPDSKRLNIEDHVL